MNQTTSSKNGWSLIEIYEILRDCMCFEFILEIKRTIKNVETKNYISMFLKTIGPVFVYELANSLEKIGIKSKKEFFNSGMEKKIQEERGKFLKKVITKSTLPFKIQENMGLDFNKNVYDMNIIVDNNCNELLDMNYEIYMEDIEDNFNFWDLLFNIPRIVADTIFLCLGFDFSMETLFSMVNKRIMEISKNIERNIDCRRYSYSVHRLFSESMQLSMKDKIFILYRYRLVTSVEYLERMLPNLAIVQDKIYNIDTKTFFRKYKSIIICIIGGELKNLDSELGTAIKNDIEMKIIDKDFWTINRKLRNNIHYSKVEVMSKSEMEIIDQYQNLYINIIKKYMKEKLYINIDKECLVMTDFSKEIGKKGISKEALDKHYMSYYQQYISQGRL